MLQHVLLLLTGFLIRLVWIGRRAGVLHNELVDRTAFWTPPNEMVMDKHSGPVHIHSPFEYVVHFDVLRPSIVSHLGDNVLVDAQHVVLIPFRHLRAIIRPIVTFPSSRLLTSDFVLFERDVSEKNSLDIHIDHIVHFETVGSSLLNRSTVDVCFPM